MTWQELATATAFRDIVREDPVRWRAFVNFELLDKYIENHWEVAGEDR